MRTGAVCQARSTRYADNWGPDPAHPRGLTPQRIGRIMARHFGLRTVKGPDGTMLGYDRESVFRVAQRMGLSPA